MSIQTLMGIDIGTQSTKAALVNLKGDLMAVAATAINLDTPQPGWAEQDPRTWWESTTHNIQSLFTNGEFDPGQVLAIGVSGQMHGAVPIDSKGESLKRGVQLWCDKRPAPLVENFSHRADSTKASQIAGNLPMPSWLGFKILWEKTNQPEVYQNTYKYLLPKDYINYRLTGEIATDYSEGSGSYLMDITSKDWSDDLINYLDLNRAKLPDIHDSSDIIGEVTEIAASLTGLTQGTPVIAGGGDMLCTLLAAGITKPGIASDITGTSSIFSVFTEKPVLDPRLMNLHHVLPGWIPFGIIDSGGVALKWFKESFCQMETNQAEALGIETYDILTEAAAKTDPGAEGLLFFPYLMGERTLGSPYSRGVFFGLTPRSDKGLLVRAIMEGVTFELRRTLEIVEQAGHPIDVVYHNGGGANSPLWNHIKADIYQKVVQTFSSAEGGILGAAILAGVGAGVFPDPSTGADVCLKLSGEYLPNPAYSERYQRLFRLFKDLHDRFQEPFNSLSRI